MSVTEQAISRLRDLIASGELRPGDRLPPEQELAQQLGLSRSSLREAVRALVQARVLDVRQGDGTYVTSLEPSLLMSGVVFAMDLLQGDQLLEIFEVRRLLEPSATALAARRAREADVERLRATVRAMRENTDAEARIALDLEFHELVAAMTGNETLCSMLEALHTRALRARLWRLGERGGETDWALGHHELIVDAIAKGDAELARAAASVHLADAEAWLRGLVGA